MDITLDDLRRFKYLQFLQCFASKQSADEDSVKFHCNIKKCNKIYRDKSGAIRHLRSNHKEYYDTIRENNAHKSTSFESFEIRVKVDPEKIWEACVELICVNALPLAFVEFPAFKQILKPYVLALKRIGYDLNITREKIKVRIADSALKIKSKIRSEINGKLVSLMADIGSRYNRSVLGVSIAYNINGNPQQRTIGMHVLKFAHTASYIADIIKTNLSDFGIQLNQVVSMTTDNGRNMIKSVSILDAAYQDSKISESANEDSPRDDDDEYIDSDIFDDVHYETLLSEVREFFPDALHTDIIYGISCAAHCIHLVVTQAIEKSLQTKALIDKARKLAKTLRTPRVRAIMGASGFNMAIIDVITRWNSISTMVIIYNFFRSNNKF